MKLTILSLMIAFAAVNTAICDSLRIYHPPLTETTLQPYARLDIPNTFEADQNLNGNSITNGGAYGFADGSQISGVVTTIPANVITGRLSTLVLGTIRDFEAPDNYVILGPSSYASTITNIGIYADGGDWVGDLFTSERTNPIYGRTLVSTGLTFTAGVAVQDSATSISVDKGKWIGFVITNGAPTNAWISLEIVY